MNYPNDPPFAITDDEKFIRPIMTAMGYADSVFEPPLSGNRVVVVFVLPSTPIRYACFLGEHFHTDPKENGFILATLSSTHFSAHEAAEFFAQALTHTQINADKLPSAPPAHIVSRN
jgi:hypothetical protein